jgi:GPH family glycoside/pentoside/hexuronide:cation symporter
MNLSNNSVILSLKEKIGYSLGDAASNLYFQIVMAFIPIFYTDVFGLPAAALSVMFLVTRLWDAVNDPIMGIIADRTNTRWGKYRPYLLWVALPFTIVSVLTFTTPDFDDTGKLIYAYLTYSVMTSSNVERTKLSSFRFVAAFSGGLIVQSTILYLVKFFGNGNEALGWQWAVACLGGLAFILFIITFLSTKERVYPPKEQKLNFKQDLRELFTNKSWVIIGIATIFQLIFIVTRTGSVTYYVKYYIREQDFNFLGSMSHLSIEFLTTAFLVSGSVALILGAILSNRFTKNIDKRTIYGSFLVSSALVCSIYYLIPADSLILIYAANLIISFLFGTVSVLQWAMYTDSADYGEWKFGRRATGLIMAASLFALKLGLTLGGAIIGWILAAYNFEPNVTQTDYSLTGIVLLISVIPAIFGILGGLLMIFYPITNKKMIDIEEDLKTRRAE